MKLQIPQYASDALRDALRSLTGNSFEIRVQEDGGATKMENPLVWRQPFSLAEGALFWLISGEDVREAVGRMILGGAEDDAISEEDLKSTWHEIAGQTTGAMAHAISATLGREVLASGGAESQENPGSDDSGVWLEVISGENRWHVRIAWNSLFVEALEPPEPGRAVDAPEAVSSKMLNLLMDVALPVSISFGKTSLQIREVLKLNTGSVVELNRLVKEPVDVIVNNCVIARGEVVVVDGNYGVRVIQLASREDRLRSGMSEASSRLGMGAK